MTTHPDPLVERLAHVRPLLVIGSLTGFVLVLVVARLEPLHLSPLQWRWIIGLGNLLAFGSLGLLVGSLVPAQRPVRLMTALLGLMVALVGVLSFWGMVRPW